MMRVSIALATYNGERYLLEQLQSFVSQTRLPDEVVVSDDSSTDATVGIVQSFAEEAKLPVVVCRNEINVGFVRNFAAAVQKCAGDVIFLSDQDDVWHPEKIAVVLEAFDNQQDAWVVVHDAELVDEELRSDGRTKLGQIRATGYADGALVTGALTAVSRRGLSWILPIPEHASGHDVWIHELAGRLGKRVVVPAVLQKLRRHSSNTSGWIASSVGKVGRWDRLAKAARKPTATSYFDRLYLNRQLRQRIAEIRAAGVELAEGRYESALADLAEERAAILERQQLVRQGRLSRWAPAMHMLLTGRYRYFNGLLSFARDVAR